jgi:murein DD-endopeptidase MepM/ murein hydrolase activator NlpD
MSISFQWPIQPPPKTTPGQQFGVKRSAAGKPHTGLDMGSGGIKVLASAPGVVTVSLDTHDARGKVVYIKHDGGYETRYFHLDSQLVHKNDIVHQGQQIGIVGKSGLPKPWPHLHFEILLNGNYSNPVDLLPASSGTPSAIGGNATSASFYPPDAPSISGGVWPVSGTKDYRVAQGMSGRAIGHERSSGARTHAGIDLFAKHKDTLVAVADGQIINFYFFYRGTFCLFVDHGSFVVNYGEVEPDSLAQYGLKTPMYRSEKGPTMTYSSRGASLVPILAPKGSKVQAGQPIAKVGQMFRSSMLHIEVYASGTKNNKRWVPFQSSPPSGLLNPTNTLIEISTGKRQPKKEIVPTELVCR